MGKKSRSGSNRRLIVYLLVLLIAACVYYFIQSGPAADIPNPASTPEAPAETDDGGTAQGELTVYVIDVGQGDSILLLSPSGKTMLIDAGESSAFPAIDALLKELNIKRLDIAVATHPHSDHIGAMEKVIRNYEIGAFYMPPVEHTTKTFENMLTALDELSVPVKKAEVGSTEPVSWDDAVQILVLSPFDVEYDDLNDYSIMLNVRFKETAVMLTGDAEQTAEALALKELPNRYFKADVLKLGHHGSSTSTSDKFLAKVDPEIAVISVGAGNDYGHPHDETIEKLKSSGISVYRTDENGTVKIVLDGTNVKVLPDK
ncbi:MAG: ComEC family competence protein [Firmicutes bacterium ADurb.Bin182]|nr:MAG: ComEC family competence protein [Firmicutes bacterium ADurb.Bin182]